MSFTKLAYDKETYKTDIKQSKKSGLYYLEQPQNNQCYPYPVSVIPQKQGVSVSRNKHLVDVSSELLGITKRATSLGAPHNKCDVDCDTGYPCGQGVIGQCGNLKSGLRVGDDQLKHLDNGFIPAEETRTSNPSCNLRGTGWNRWEWLGLNPQSNVERPFPNNISNRIVVKDNHRPVIPNPIDVSASLPNGSSAGYTDDIYSKYN